MARNVDGTVITKMSPSHRSSLTPARCAAARSPTDTAAIRRPFPGQAAAQVTHAGVTAELLRNLLGDDALPPGVLAAGIPPCVITTVDDLNPVMIASVSHLR